MQTLERLEVDQRQLSLFNQSASPDSSQGVLWRHLTAIIMKTSLTPWPTTTRPPFPSRTVEIPGKVPSVRAMRCKPGAGLGAGTVWSAPTRTVQRSAQSAPWNSSHGGRWRSVTHGIRMRPSEFRGSFFFLSPLWLSEKVTSSTLPYTFQSDTVCRTLLGHLWGCF